VAKEKPRTTKKMSYCQKSRFVEERWRKESGSSRKKNYEKRAEPSQKQGNSQSKITHRLLKTGVWEHKRLGKRPPDLEENQKIDQTPKKSFQYIAHASA